MRIKSDAIHKVLSTVKVRGAQIRVPGEAAPDEASVVNSATTPSKEGP